MASRSRPVIAPTGKPSLLQTAPTRWKERCGQAHSLFVRGRKWRTWDFRLLLEAFERVVHALLLEEEVHELHTSGDCSEHGEFKTQEAQRRSKRTWSKLWWESVSLTSVRAAFMSRP